MHTLQDKQDGFTGIDKLRDELLMVLKNIHKEKQEEKLKVVAWCHLGHAYIKEVSEGERKMQVSLAQQVLFFALESHGSDAMTNRELKPRRRR